MRWRWAWRAGAKWGLTGLAAVLLVLGPVSGRWPVTCWAGSHARSVFVGVESGSLYVSLVAAGIGSRDPVVGATVGGQPWEFYCWNWTWIWRPRTPGLLIVWELGVPFWVVVIASGAGAAGLWRRDWLARRAREGLCVGCGYELIGLAEDAACPECGKART